MAKTSDSTDVAMRDPNVAAAKVFKRVTIVMCSALTLFTAAVILPPLLIRQTETVTITRIDAARECRSRKSLKIFPKYRSETPMEPIEYCGVVFSDHGTFVLPESIFFPWFGPTRKTLFDSLAEGCRYTVTVVGPGLALEEGRDGMSNRNRTLQRLTPVVGCFENSHV